MTDYPKVRRLRFCLCGQPKDQGLVLCWPCHRRENRQYSAETLRLLDRLEASTLGGCPHCDQEHEPGKCRFIRGGVERDFVQLGGD